MIINLREILYHIVLKIIILCSIQGCSGAGEASRATEDEFPGSSRLSELLGDRGVEGYAKAIEPRVFHFPADHGPHPAYRNEWWYFTGNLDGADGERFGFELTIFRFSLTPRTEAPAASAWRTNQVYIGHFAVTDVAEGNFHVAQRYSRGGVGLAGAAAQPFRVWLDDWSIAAADNEPSWRLRAADADIALDLQLLPAKPVVLNGAEGLSQKSSRVGNASYYYSMPRLRSAGRLTIGGRSYAVSGLSWLDREWGSSALSPDQRGWDWFALQLSDGTDLMFYTLRRNDGTRDRHSAGTWIDADGRAHHLANEDVTIDVMDFWESERGDRYPSAWDIVIPARELSVRVTPVLDNQELITNVRYWEGAVDVDGLSGGRRIDGRGYVELTGYAGN